MHLPNGSYLTFGRNGAIDPGGNIGSVANSGLFDATRRSSSAGGSDAPADDYGNYANPVIDTWDYAASQDCQRIIPESTGRSAPKYVQYNNMIQGHTMGQSFALSRSGFITHVMNMGQRHLQLNNTCTVNGDSYINLYIAQILPDPALLTPGPAVFWAVLNDIPSDGTVVQVGNGQIGTQSKSTANRLPASVQLSSASGSGSGGSNTNSSTCSHKGVVIGGIVGGVAVIATLEAQLAK